MANHRLSQICGPAVLVSGRGRHDSAHCHLGFDSNPVHSCPWLRRGLEDGQDSRASHHWCLLHSALGVLGEELPISDGSVQGGWSVILVEGFIDLV